MSVDFLIGGLMFPNVPVRSPKGTSLERVTNRVADTMPFVGPTLYRSQQNFLGMFDWCINGYASLSSPLI